MTTRRILLVEEDAHERARRATTLVERGYLVQTASDACEAASLCGPDRPDLILVGLERNVQKVSAAVAILRKGLPGVPVAALMHKTHRLCAVGLDDVTVIAAEQPADFLLRVARLLDSATRSAPRAATTRA